MSLKVWAHTSPHPLELGGRLQRRTVIVLSIATILGGLGIGAGISVGALLLAEVSGSEAISGFASAALNGGAAIAGIPLARVAARYGRRMAVVLGSLVAMVGAAIAVAGASLGLWPVVVLGIATLGVASAVQLMSRFAATDLALPRNRARDLSLVVWAITIGAVVGPNLMAPGAVVGEWIGIPPLSGVFVFTFGAQALAAVVNWVGLRPDPLLTARAISDREVSAATERGDAPVAVPDLARLPKITVIVMIGVAQALMVGLMAMAPLHIMHHDPHGEPVVGVTLSLHIAGMYALSPVFGVLATKVGRLPVIFLGWVIFALSIVLAYAADSDFLLVQVALTLVGVGWGAVTVAGAALLTDLTEVQERPRWQGRSDACMSASGATAGVLAGVVYAASDYAFLALVCGFILVVGVIASLYPKLRVPKQH
ncbi:MFS transporter [Leucobacter denitrificans]|uniref:MFS transporter n=1 Tax=Leucobacter denitrificans TaxID=683042 RepID=A0A7G9S671_9MICO|nr:MFS transporter [Leucobacter denitrificans]QNN63346.1 MFS transporter [Leucobacter denitrificans]